MNKQRVIDRDPDERRGIITNTCPGGCKFTVIPFTFLLFYLLTSDLESRKKLNIDASSGFHLIPVVEADTFCSI